MKILTNLAFSQSRIWTDASTTICRDGETPDDLPPLRQAWRLWRRRKGHDAVVTMGARASLFYGLLCAATRTPSRQVMMEYFLDIPRPSSWRWRFKHVLYRLVARRALGILVNSTGEIASTAARFDLPREKVLYVPMYSTIEPPECVESNDGTILSVGRTLRDNATLLAAARRFRAPLVLVVGKHDGLPAQLPPNVELLREIPLEEAHRLVRRAAVVVIPLLPAERSTGQVVVLEAMALGKPVVATELAGTVDLIENGVDGVLVPAGDIETLATSVNHLLGNPGEARALGRAAFRRILATGSADHRGRALLDATAALATRA